MRRSLAPPQFNCFQNGAACTRSTYLTQQVTQREADPAGGEHGPARPAPAIGAHGGVNAMVMGFDLNGIVCRPSDWWSQEIVRSTND